MEIPAVIEVQHKLAERMAAMTEAEMFEFTQNLLPLVKARYAEAVAEWERQQYDRAMKGTGSHEAYGILEYGQRPKKPAMTMAERRKLRRRQGRSSRTRTRWPGAAT